MHRGYTILETVVATFILAGAVLMLLATFDAGLKNLQASTQLSKALLLAQSDLDRVRGWCQDPGHFHNPASFPSMGSFAAISGSSGFESRVDLLSRACYSPDWTSEMLHLPSERRELTASTLQASVTVRWGLGANRQVQLAATLAEPNCGWSLTQPIRIVMTPATATLAQGEVRQFTATAYDQANRAMPGITFSWMVLASSSDGSLQNQSRDGHRVEFIHQLKKPGGGTTYGAPGEVWVLCRGRFWGVEKTERQVLQLL